MRSTARSLERRFTIRPRRTSGASTSNPSPRTTSSWKSGPNTARRISRRVRHLVGAEIARIEDRDLDAMHLYEKAIRSARDNGFLHNEALANELMGHFCLQRGLETSAYGHLRNAWKCYDRWRADGKVRQLERRHPWLAEMDLPSTGPTGLTAQNLDVTSVVSASQALSREIVLPKLVETLMTIALENAGADRGLLILRQEEIDWIEAEAHTRRGKVEVVLQRAPVSADSCADALVRYVIRTQQSVIVDDVFKRDVFLDDDYLKSHQVRSILGLPLLLQGKFVGVLYVENSLTAHAFTSKRIAVLELLAAQAAISLENTRLYSALQEREARVRRAGRIQYHRCLHLGRQRPNHRRQ